MGGIMDTETGMDKICQELGLTPYQSDELRHGAERYDIRGLVKRGDVLYAPHVARGFWDGVRRLFFGVPADLIGRDKTMLRAARGIRFCAGGCHRVKTPNGYYYADATGRMISRDEFRRRTGR